jgi:hypothetical protein
MNLQEWNELNLVEKKRLSSKYGITLRGNNELWSEFELVKVPEAPIQPEVVEVEELVVVKSEPLEVKRVIKKYAKKPAEKLGAKKPVKKLASSGKRGRPVSKLAGRKKK